MTKEYIKPIQESVIAKERYKEYEAAGDILERLKVTTVDFKKSRDSLLAHLGIGLNNYRKDLFKQALLFTEPDTITKELEKVGIKSSNVHKLSVSIVEQLRTTKKISAVQALLLHQVCSINCIYTGLDEVRTKGVYSQKSLLDILIILNDVNTHSRYLVQIAQTDSDSYRLFQVLNHFAYSAFTAEIWKNYIGKSSVNNTLQNFAKLVISTLKSNANEGAYTSNFAKSNLELALDDARDAIVDFFANHDKDLQRRIEQLSNDVLPSFLGIRHAGSENKRLYILLCELIDIEDKIKGFKVSSNLFHDYLTVCVNNQDSVIKIKQNIDQYIKFARLAKEQREYILISGADTDLDFLAIEKKDRSKLLVIFNNAAKLLNEEIDQLAKLTLEEQEKLKVILAKLPVPAVNKMVELLNKKVLPAELHAQVDAIVKNSNIPKLSEELISKGIAELFAVKNSRISYYNRQSKILKKELEAVDCKIIKRIDLENCRAQALLGVNDKITSIITSNQHNGVLGGVIFNPTEFALEKCMPYILSARLEEIEKINKELPVLKAIYSDGEQFRTNTWLNSKPVTNSYARLEQSIRELDLKHEQYQINNLMLTLESTIISTDKQLAEFTLKHQKNFAFNYSINRATMKTLNKGDYHIAEEIKQEIHKVKVKLFEQNRSRLALVQTSELLNYVNGSVAPDKIILTKRLSALKDVIGLYNDIPELAARTSKLQKLRKTIKAEFQNEAVDNEKLKNTIADLELELKQDDALAALNNINSDIEGLTALIAKKEKESKFKFNEVKIDLVRLADYYSSDSDRCKLALIEKPVDMLSYPKSQGWINYILNKTVLGIKIYNKAVKTLNILKIIAKFIVLIVTYPLAVSYKFLNRKLKKNHRQFIKVIEAKITKIQELKDSKGLSAGDINSLNILIKKLKSLDDQIGRYSTNFYNLVFEDYAKINNEYKEIKDNYRKKLVAIKHGLEGVVDSNNPEKSSEDIPPDALESDVESTIDTCSLSSVSIIDDELEEQLDKLKTDLDLTDVNLDESIQHKLTHDCHLFIVGNIYNTIFPDFEKQKLRLSGLLAPNNHDVPDTKKQVLAVLNDAVGTYESDLDVLKNKIKDDETYNFTKAELESLDDLQKKISGLKHNIDDILNPPKPEDILKDKAIAEADELFATVIGDGPLRQAAVKALAAAKCKAEKSDASEFNVSIEFLKVFADSVLADQGGAMPAIAQAIDTCRKHFADTTKQGIVVCYSKMVDYLIELVPRKYSEAQDCAMSYLTLDSTDDERYELQNIFDSLKAEEAALIHELNNLKDVENTPEKAARIYEIYDKLMKLDKKVDATIYPPTKKDQYELTVADAKEKLALKFLSSDILTNAVKSGTSAAMDAALACRPGDMPAAFLKAILTEFTTNFTSDNGEFFADILSKSKTSLSPEFLSVLQSGFKLYLEQVASEHEAAFNSLPEESRTTYQTSYSTSMHVIAQLQIQDVSIANLVKLFRINQETNKFRVIATPPEMPLQPPTPTERIFELVLEKGCDLVLDVVSHPSLSLENLLTDAISKVSAAEQAAKRDNKVITSVASAKIFSDAILSKVVTANDGYGQLADRFFAALGGKLKIADMVGDAVGGKCGKAINAAVSVVSGSSRAVSGACYVLGGGWIQSTVVDTEATTPDAVASLLPGMGGM